MDQPVAEVENKAPATLGDWIAENRRLWDLGDAQGAIASDAKRQRKESGEIITTMMTHMGVAQVAVDGIAKCVLTKRTHYRVEEREVFAAWLKENLDALYLVKLDMYSDKIREYVDVEGAAPPGVDKYEEVVLTMARN